MEAIKFAILTVSDRCFHGKANDLSGPNLKEKLGDNGLVLKTGCVPDDIDQIEALLNEWTQVDNNIDIILTTGGTGVGVRDVTPEATKRVIDKETPAINIAMCISSLEITPMAMLARGISGIKNNTLIINLPGSVKGSEECLNSVLPCLKHAVDLLRNNKESIENVHNIVQNQLKEVTSKVEVDNIAERCRESPWPLISVEESLDIVMKHVLPAQTQVVPLKEALGKIVAEDILANDPLPPFRASIKDGYALRSEDGPDIYTVIGGIAAGSAISDIELNQFECVRVNTGSMIPASADAVIQVEDTKLYAKSEDGKEQAIVICKSVTSGQDIREIGSDIEKGERILCKGDVINAIEVGLLATVGVTQVPVYKLPAVAVISTGNELLEPYESLKPGMIRDSNRTTLISLLKENGFVAHDMGIAKDEPTELMKILKRAMTVCDIVITTGSVSMGDKDYLKSVLKLDFLADIHFGRVNMKPGKPTTFATCIFNEDKRKKLLFCLAGNPVSASVTFHLYVLPTLKAISGYAHCFPMKIIAKNKEQTNLETSESIENIKKYVY